MQGVGSQKGTLHGRISVKIGARGVGGYKERQAWAISALRLRSVSW